jgi:hypothetical protein
MSFNMRVGKPHEFTRVRLLWLFYGYFMVILWLFYGYFMVILCPIPPNKTVIKGTTRIDLTLRSCHLKWALIYP